MCKNCDKKGMAIEHPSPQVPEFGLTNEGFNHIQTLIRALLVAIGENPDREGLEETPKRVAKFWREFVNYDGGKIDTAFAQKTSGQIVAVSGMRVWSLCEHHLMPFWADISIGYIPSEKVLGLSKFARIAHKNASKLQLQERLVKNIIADVKEVTGSESVIVHAKGIHTCMIMRGIKTDGVMTSLGGDGKFNSIEMQNFFLNLIQG